MKTARIEIIIRTYFENRTYRNNKVVIPIRDEWAKEIGKDDAYTYCRNCFAQFLANNQIASIRIYDNNNELMQGFDGINSIDLQNDIWQVKGEEEW